MGSTLFCAWSATITDIASFCARRGPVRVASQVDDGVDGLEHLAEYLMVRQIPDG